MLNALAGIIESLSTIGRVIANFFSGLIELIALVVQSTVFLYQFISAILPLPLQIIATAVVSAGVIYLIIGREH